MHEKCCSFSRTEGTHSRRRSWTEANLESWRCQSGHTPKASVSPYFENQVSARKIALADVVTYLIELAVVASNELTEVRIGVLQHRKSGFVPEPWIFAFVFVIIPKREVQIAPVRLPLHFMFFGSERRRLVEKAHKTDKISHTTAWVSWSKYLALGRLTSTLYCPIRHTFPACGSHQLPLAMPRYPRSVCREV